MSVAPQPIRLSPTGKFITVVVIIALAVLLLVNVQSILSPFIAAAIFSYLFNPLISWLNRRTGVHRAVWIFALYGLIGLLLYWLVRFLVPIITQQYADLTSQIPAIFDTIARQIQAQPRDDPFGIGVDLGRIEEELLGFASEIGRRIPETVPHLVFSAVETILLFVTFLLVTFYGLLRGPEIVESIYQLVPAPYQAEIRGLGGQIDRILSGYVRGTLLLIPIMAFLTYIVLRFLGVRYALVIAIATGVLETIPLIGPWTAAGIAMAVAFFQGVTPFGWSPLTLVVVVGICYFVLRMLEDNFIIPYVVGHAVEMHPVLVIFAILSGGALAGPFGLLVAIPVAAIVQLLLRYCYRKLVDAPPDLEPPPAPPVAEAEPALERPVERSPELAGSRTTPLAPRGEQQRT
jgi:predicted PurR-regulated permease PerM